MKILVTGASGFIGGSFVERFRKRAHIEMHGIGRRQLNMDGYTSIDLCRSFDLAYNPDIVIHAAARAAPWGTAQDFQRQNVDATKNVIDFCTNRGLPKLVYLSSSSVFYRSEHQYGITENSPIGPAFVNRYAATKYAGERLVMDYPGPWVILRPRAVFGPGDTVLFPRIVTAAQRGRLPCFVGIDPPAMGDLIHIDTLTDYMLTAALNPQIKGCFNLTNNQPVPMQAFLLDVLDQLKLPRPSRRISIRTAMILATLTEWTYRALRLRSEPPITRFGVGVFAYSKTFDVSKALSILGPPSVSLEDGVSAFIQWQKNQWP